MSINILRTVDGWWIETADGASPIPTYATTTRELLAETDAIRLLAGQGPVDPVPLRELDLLSPVTTPCRVVAQMVNYASHARDSGFNLRSVPTTFFRKTSGSISGAFDDVVKPAHVRFLDYEVELALVFGDTMRVGDTITEADLPRLIAGLVLANDVSAREVQLTKSQFYESKSYPTFTPVGPRLVLLDESDFTYLHQDLRLTLSVNRVVRQDSTVADMISQPLESLRVLSRFQQMDPGDILLTGTPGGTALKAPPKAIEKVAALLPTAAKWRAFFRSQANNAKYLSAGDVIEATIRSSDGAVDLGSQHTTVVDEEVNT
jgi:2-keto-4-pentenoate hydratase/2-oxohepta-3-ene-1,7-dioic acid hydratase in catechol pathway